MTDPRAALWRDLANPRLVFSFFTFVAASDVLGVQIALRGFVTIPPSVVVIGARGLRFPSLFQFWLADIPLCCL